MVLNDDQCKAILAEGLARKMFEPAVPVEESDRIYDTERLVNACLLARKAGNKSDGVNSILFIAEADMKPEIDIVDGMEQTKISVEDNMHNGLNLAELADGILDQLIVGLDKYPQTDEVEIDRKAYTAEKERRENASKPAGEAVEEDPSAQTAPEEAEASDERQEGMAHDGDTGSDFQGEPDAGAFARVQTPETSGKGDKNEAQAQEKDGERAELEAQLTFDMIKAHDIDIVSLSSAPLSTLQFIIENPDGPPADTVPKENKDMAIDESKVEAIPTQKLNPVGGISAVEVEPQVISKADLGLEVDKDDSEETPAQSSGISPDRERLESLITGPLLKSWQKGRREVPSIGDNELRLMILNPTAQVSSEELQKAQDLDNPLMEDEPEDQGILPGQEREMAEAEQSESQAEQEIPYDKQMNVVKRKEELEQANVEIEKTGFDVETSVSGQDRARGIIQKENFPIPNELDERPPILPADVSKVSRDELFSYHAQFHAAETRINFVISGIEDEHDDIEKLRRNREVEVANSIPLLSTEDNKRITNEFRDSRVAADSEVMKYSQEEHEVNKTLNKLKVLQKNYYKDCERLSRQMSKYEKEKLDGPR